MAVEAVSGMNVAGYVVSESNLALFDAAIKDAKNAEPAKASSTNANPDLVETNGYVWADGYTWSNGTPVVPNGYTWAD